MDRKPFRKYDWREIGVTPVSVKRYPLGLSRVRFELDGYLPRETANFSSRFMIDQHSAFGERGITKMDDFTIDSNFVMSGEVITNLGNFTVNFYTAFTNQIFYMAS